MLLAFSSCWGALGGGGCGAGVALFLSLVGLDLGIRSGGVEEILHSLLLFGCHLGSWWRWAWWDLLCGFSCSLVLPIGFVDSYVALVVSGCPIGGSLGILLTAIGSCSGCTLIPWLLLTPVCAVTPGWLLWIFQGWISSLASDQGYGWMRLDEGYLQ